MISQKSIQEVMDAARIEEVVGDFVNLKRRGVNLAGLCPFHNERTPSFYVSPAKNIFKCFGCSRGGDPVHFIMEHENITFPEAIRYLAKKYRIELEETQATEEAQQEMLLLDSLHLINQFALEFFQQQLFETDKGKSVGLAYFKQRGFREETIRKFGLGFAPENQDAFTTLAVGKGYNIDLLRKLGLTSQYDRDFFRNRVMFTIHNLSGKPIAFAGRIMSKDVKAPKYINSPETDIYHKSKVLYGASFARKAIRQADECILVEGYTDVISLHQNGIENVVASSGTALTLDQIRLIKRFTNNVKILYDGDAAGIRAALRGLDMALEEDLNVRVVVLPEAEDPDSYIQKVGTSQFQHYLDDNSKDLVQFEAELLLQHAGKDPSKRAEVIVQIARTIAKIKNPLRRDEYVKTCREMLQVDEGKLILEVNRTLQKDLEKRNRERELGQHGEALEETNKPELITSPGPAVGDTFQEKDIARLLITSGGKRLDEKDAVTVAEYVLVNIEDVLDEFDHPLYKRVAQECLQLLSENQPVSSQYFISHPDADMRQLAIDVSTSPYEFSENWEKRWEIFLTQRHPDENQLKDVENLIKRFKLRKIRRFIDHNGQKIKDLERDGGQKEELETLIRLHWKMKSIENQLAKELGTVVLK